MEDLGKKTLACLLYFGLLIFYPARVIAQEPVLKIVSSFYPVYISTLKVTQGAPNVSLRNMTSSGIGCLHDYQLSTQDMLALADADVLVVNGAGMEGFIEKVKAQKPDLRILDASAEIPLLCEGGNCNPHVWLDLRLYKKQVQNIAAGLANLSPARADVFLSNAQTYVQEIEQLRQRMEQELLPLKGAKIVTFHEAFPYFAREFGMEIAAVIEREPGSEPSAKELADTIKTVRKLRIDKLFVEPQYSSKSAEVIARETGAKVYTLDPAVTGPMTPNAYLEIMQSNLSVLRQALSH